MHMIPSTRFRHAVLPIVAAAALAAGLPAHANVEQALKRVAGLAASDPRAALMELDRLAAAARRAGLAADIEAVRSARCWLLSYTEPDKALALVASIAGASDPGDHPSTSPAPAKTRVS